MLGPTRQVKKGWQAFDCLDEDWCPIVQLHGIFTDISTDALPGGPYPGVAARARTHNEAAKRAPRKARSGTDAPRRLRVA
jgi:hypothetical protein